MAGNRKAAEAFICKWVDELLPGGTNGEMYKTFFARMSDAEFEEYMRALANETATLQLEAPNLSKHKVTIENNFRVAKELGHVFFERLRLTDPATGTVYLTPVKYLIVDLTLRRQQQMLIKKVSIPENNRHVDEMTGQPTGDSQSSSITFPELQVLYAQGFDKAIEEFIKFRGGDIKAGRKLDRQIIETGGASLDAIASEGETRVKSTEVLSTLLKGMHISNTL